MASKQTHGSHRRDNSRSSNETVRADSSTGLPRYAMIGKSKTCTVWVHNDKYAREDVLLDLDILGKGLIRPGDLVEVAAISISPEIRDFQDRDQSSRNNTAIGILDAINHEPNGSNWRRGRRHTINSDKANESVSEHSHHRSSYVFVAKTIPEAIKSKASGLQISLAMTIANTFGLSNGDQVTVSLADQEEHTASHVEIVFRDIYLSRADMWRLLLSELCDKAVYKGQKLLFLGTIKATIKTVYAHGKKVSSAYFSSSTIPIYRSESARYVLFIQMSREMWNFDSEGTGEILFSRVIDGFLPDLFKRWQALDAKHLVSIVMFARLEYDYHQLVSLGQLHSADLKQSQFDSGRTKYKDFYRVVVTDMASGQWTLILNTLKKEFRVFLRDISIQEASFIQNPSTEKPENVVPGKPRIAGRPSLALRGNILEAINIAASQFGRDHIDRDLVRTGISVVVITPGSGIFEVDRELLRLTSENMTNNGMGIDLVCLSKMPLHSVPLFKYHPPTAPAPRSMSLSHDPAGTRAILGTLNANRLGVSPSGNMLSTTPKSTTAAWRSNHNADNFLYGIPQWIDVSFWAATSPSHDAKNWNTSRASYLDPKFTKSFVPQVRMYELQMMGLMEIGLANIAVPYLSEGPQGLQRRARNLGSRRSLALKSSNRHLSNLSSSHRSQAGYLDHGESPQSSRKGARALIAAHNRSTKHKLERMEEYDRTVFQTQTHRKKENKKKLDLVQASPTEHRVIPKTRPKLSESVTTSAMIPTLTPERPETPGSDYQGKSRQGSISSIRPVMTPLQKVAGTSRITRSISFALRGLGTAPPRALASTSINVENISAAGMIKGDSSTNKLGSAATKSPDSIRQKAGERFSIDSGGSDRSDSNRSPVPFDKSPSRPISIKRSTNRVIGHNHHLGDETTSSYTAVPTKIDEARENGDMDPKRTSMDSQDGGGNSPRRGQPEIMAHPFTRESVFHWIKNVNPSNPTKNNPNAAAAFGRWQHIFPRAPRASTMKWRSLCTPASVPLTTEIFPTKAELENEFTQTPYTVHQEADPDVLDVPKTRETLVKEMIGLRFSHGYQAVVGPAVADVTGTELTDASLICDIGKLAQDGNVIFMSMGNTIQKLAFSDEKDVHITKYVRKFVNEKRSTHIDYTPHIRTILSPRYLVRPIKIGGYGEEYPWSRADAFLAGQKGYQAQTAEQLKFWRARFVLIPVDPPQKALRGLQIMGHDTAEEIHLTGIKILSQLWQKYRHIPADERIVKLTIGNGRRKDPNPLDIMYQTRNPSEVVAGELDRLLAAEEKGDLRPTQLLPESELFQREQFSLPHLAQVLQGERGVEIVSRRWHLRLHSNCFIGSDFTTWVMQNFKDVGNREEAVEIGNMLMDRKLFYHVEQRHNFRDGNYFYQIAPEYTAPRNDYRNSWFSGRRPERSVPSTPVSESVNRDSPLSSRSRSDSSSNLDTLANETPSGTPTKQGKGRHSISLSKVMRINVDHRNRSKRAELVDLHYDRLHNPENCYHLELSWINVTSKLLEDAIVLWATTAEKYGLRLVEVPIDEISSISSREPFRSPYHVRLSLPPPAFQPTPTYFNSTSLGPQQGPPDRHYYQKMLLRKFNFVLDLEAASDFPSDVDVTYSWGKPDYQYSQYIHRSGILLCQIGDDGNFILLANRLYNTRSALTKDAPAGLKGESVTMRHDSTPFHRRSQLSTSSQHPPSGQTPHTNPISPHPSPLIRASSDVLGGRNSLDGTGLQQFLFPEDIKDEMEKLCSDPIRLEKFYRETAVPITLGGRGTGRLAGATPTIIEEQSDVDGELDASIPSLVLPASVVGSPIASKQRRVSPQNGEARESRITILETTTSNGSSNNITPLEERQPIISSASTGDLRRRRGSSTASERPRQDTSMSDSTLSRTSPSPSGTTNNQTGGPSNEQDQTPMERELAKRRPSIFPPSPAISAISAAIEASPQLIGRDAVRKKSVAE